MNTSIVYLLSLISKNETTKLNFLFLNYGKKNICSKGRMTKLSPISGNISVNSTPQISTSEEYLPAEKKCRKKSSTFGLQIKNFAT